MNAVGYVRISADGQGAFQKKGFSCPQREEEPTTMLSHMAPCPWHILLTRQPVEFSSVPQLNRIPCCREIGRASCRERV